MRVVRILGRSGSGKTSLIEALIRACASARISVATIKHSRTPMTHPQTNKDTARHFAAGAKASAGLSPGYSEFFVRDVPFTLDELFAFFDGKVDLVLVEGAREYNLPTIILGDLPDESSANDILLRLQPRPLLYEKLTNEILDLIATLPDFKPNSQNLK